MSHHHHTDFPKKRFHRDWRFIVAVLLMLAAIVAYVLTLDERIVPGPAPADAPVTAPANPYPIEVNPIVNNVTSKSLSPVPWWLVLIRSNKRLSPLMARLR